MKMSSSAGFSVLAAGAMLIAGSAAHAVPSFARQTGLACTTCHLSWPELTTVGRQFKLGAYTLMRPEVAARAWVPTTANTPAPVLPLAAMMQLSATHTRRANGADLAQQNTAVLQDLSVFYAGRISPRSGAFAQWTYDGVAHHSAVDNIDLRVADQRQWAGIDLRYGLTVNNNPTVSDIYNTTPAWRFPFASSGVAVTPNAATMLDGGLAQQVAGLGVYTLWNQTLYAELAAYRTADRMLSVFRAGTDKAAAAALQGNAPYWRVALQQAWDAGAQSAMLGAYGMEARKFPDNTQPNGATDRFQDRGVDAQYQYITDRHRFSAQLSWLNEKQHYDASFPTATSNVSDTLRVFNGKLSYYYQSKYGATIGYFRTSGNVDNSLYNTGEALTGSIDGSPKTRGYILEADWLPVRNVRLLLQYTAYQEFNGRRSNYDGFGRNAADNNSLYAVAWLMF